VQVRRPIDNFGRYLSALR